MTHEADLLSGQHRALALIAGSQLLVLSLWFSASAVADTLQQVWQVDARQVPLLTLSLQLGFVVGALGSALTNLTDRLPTRLLFTISALVGATLNVSLVLLGPGDFWWAVVIRLLIGVTLAGVYPSGLKAVAGWFREGRGAALGTLVGALTVGSALPHLIRGLGFDWREVVGGASALSVIGALMMMAAGDGPFEVPTRSFSWTHLAGLVANRGFRLATVGYLGHMWELYAAWAWITAYLVASGSKSASQVTFAVVAVGGLGAWLAGRLADHRGRTLAAGGSMVLSGSMAALTSVVFGRSMWILMPVLVVWGLTVVSDSAQFSAIVTEVVPDAVRGTALTLQTALGFLLTLVSIWLVPRVAEATSWRWAFLVLVPGPIVGTLAMVRLGRGRGAAEFCR